MDRTILNSDVKYFNLSMDMYTTGFQEHATIDLFKPIEPQLRRQRLNPNLMALNAEEIRQIIEYNASLRFDFGWSFESSTDLEAIMRECVAEITPKYSRNIARMVSDMRCSWLGFEPHNMYDKDSYRDLNLYGLVHLNNELIDFQVEVVKIVSNHPIYRQHAFLRDDWYRFESFKAVRKDRDLLADRFHYYMNAVRDISGIVSLPRDILENSIGMHFLYHPELYFELLEFSILKGDVYE
jgi:hypothetical protein